MNRLLCVDLYFESEVLGWGGERRGAHIGDLCTAKVIGALCPNKDVAQQDNENEIYCQKRLMLFSFGMSALCVLGEAEEGWKALGEAQDGYACTWEQW